MIEFTTYDPNTGQLIANIGIQEDVFDSEYKNTPKIMKIVSPIDYYFDLESKEVKLRPEFNFKFNKDVYKENCDYIIYISQNESLIIKNIPNNTIFNIIGILYLYNETYTIIDNEFEFSSKVPNVFYVDVSNFPYKPIRFTIKCNKELKNNN